MTYPDEWQPGEPWPTIEEFEAAGYVNWSTGVGTVTFQNCWTRDDSPIEPPDSLR